MLLRDVRAGSPLARLLDRLRSVGLRVDRTSWWVRLDRFEDWDAYAARLPKHMLRDQRRQWSRLNALPGGYRYEEVRDPGDLREAIRWLIDCKVSWAASRGRPVELMDSSVYRSFVEDVALGALRRDALLFVRLVSGSSTIAAGMGYLDGDSFIFHIFGYDPAWNTYSPGRLLLERILRWCFERGVKSFDLLPGDEPYKAIWATERPVVTDYLIPLTLLGRAAMLWHLSGLSRVARNGLVRGFARRMPAALRRSIGRFVYKHDEYAGQLTDIAKPAKRPPPSGAD